MESIKLLTNTYYINNISYFNNLLKIKFPEFVDLSEDDLSHIEVYTSGGKLCTILDGFVTIYKDLDEDNTIILSNDGSVYIEPEIATEEPYVPYSPTPEELVIQLDIAKNNKIKESHVLLEKYLANHPLLYTDGKHYAVTLEKQNLLTGNLLAYQLELQLGVENPTLEWNATGDECISWIFEDLSALAIAIKYYVKPYVAYQQKIEKDEIAPCTTMDELNDVVIDYETVS